MTDERPPAGNPATRRVPAAFCILASLLATPAPAADGPPRLVVEAGGLLGQTTAAVFSPDGTRLLTAGFGKSVQVWDVGWNRPALEPGTDRVTPAGVFRWEVARGDRGVVNAVAYSSEGLVAVGGRAARTGGVSTIVLYSAATREVVGCLPEDPFVRRAGGAFPPGHLRDIASLDFSPDGRRLLSGDSAGEVWLWERDGVAFDSAWSAAKLAEAGGETKTATPTRFLDDRTAVLNVRKAGPASVLRTVGLTGLAAEGRVQELAREPVGVLAHCLEPTGGRGWAFAVRSEGQGVVVLDGSPVRRKIPGRAGEVVTSLRHAGGGRLVVASRRGTEGRTSGGATLRLYDRFGRLLDEAAATESTAVYAMAVSPDGRRLVVADDGRAALLIYDLRTAAGRPDDRPLSPGPDRVVGSSVARPAEVAMPDEGRVLVRLEGGERLVLDLTRADVGPFLPQMPAGPAAAAEVGEPLPGARPRVPVAVVAGGRRDAVELDLKERLFESEIC